MKRFLSSALVLCMVLTLMMTTALADASPSAEAIITVPDTDAYTYDVFLGTDNNFPYDVAELADAVKAKLVGLGAPADKTRVTTAVNTIDTTDLTGWYVYDHYDTAHYADQAAWENAYGASNLMRPYQGISDSGETKTIEALAAQYGSDLGDWDTVHRLNHHIHSYVLNNKPAMLFTGYYSPAYTDFLYYPANSTGEQKVTFTVDSNYASAHSMHGAGFLINTGIDPVTEFISGYVLYYEFKYDSIPAKLTNIGLYKIKDNTTAADFSAANPDASSNYNQITKYCDLVGTVKDAVTNTEDPNCNWFPVMDIKLTINPTSVVVEQRKNGNGPYNVKYEWTGLTDTTYHGFGPIVRYERKGHNCSSNSMFVFSDLNMSFKSAAAEQTSNFTTLADAKFQDNSKNKFYVNLVAGDYNESPDQADLAALKVLRAGGINLITNYNNENNYPSTYMGDNAVDLNAIDSAHYFAYNNAVTVPEKDVAISKDGMDGKLTQDELAQNIAAAIYQRSLSSNNGTEPVTDDTSAVAALVLRPDNSENKKEIALIRSGFIPEGGTKVYLDTTGSVGPSAKLKFYITKPMSARTELATTKDEGTYFTIDYVENPGNWPAGEYTVTAEYAFTEGEIAAGAQSIAASKTFTMGYGVRYMVDNGNDAPAAQTKLQYESITLADGNLLTAPNNCGFAYWDDGDGHHYKANAAYSVEANAELTAKWKLNKLINSFTYNEENGICEVKWNVTDNVTLYTVKFYADEMQVGSDVTVSADLGNAENLVANTTISGPRPTVIKVVVTPTFGTPIANLAAGEGCNRDVSTISLLVDGGDGADSGYTVYSQDWVDYVFGRYGTASNATWVAQTGTIRMNKDIVVKEPIAFPKDVALDLNGCRIAGDTGKSAVVLPEDVTLTLKDSGSETKGALAGGDGVTYGIAKAADAQSLGSIVFAGPVTNNIGGEGAVISGLDGAFANITVVSGAVVDFNDTITAKGNIVISGGTVNVETVESYAIYTYNGAINITGGTVNAEGGDEGIYAYSGDIKISGGIVNAQSADDQGIYASAGDINISGGTVNAESGSDEGICASEGDITITGGIVNVKGNDDGAIYASAGTITISGGTVNAESADSHAISTCDGDITITGGTVNAKGRSDTYAIYITDDGNITLTGVQITKPSGGKLSEDKKSIVTGDGATPAADVTIQAVASSGGGGGTPTITVPVSSDAGSANVSANVSGDTAKVNVTDKLLEAVIDNAKDTGKVTVDLSGLNKRVNTAQIPAKVIGATAASDTAEGMTVKLPSGTLALDNTALSAVDKDKNIVVSVEEIKTSALSDKQVATLGDDAKNAVVVEVKVLIDGTEVHDFNGGTITVSFPYTLPAGIDPAYLTIWYLADDGTIEKIGGYYDAQAKMYFFTTTHLSDYVLVYDTDSAFAFEDVPANAYYYDAVLWAVRNGITSGTDATHFSPNWDTTRAQMVTFLWRAAGSPDPKTTACAFTDLKTDAYYYKAVLWAAENGYTKGTSATTFSPNVTVTRAQAVTFLWRIAGKLTQSGANPFADVAAEKYYYDAVLWAAQQKITEGTGATTFSPNNGCTRAQVVTFLYRYFAK